MAPLVTNTQIHTCTMHFKYKIFFGHCEKITHKRNKNEKYGQKKHKGTIENCRYANYGHDTRIEVFGEKGRIDAGPNLTNTVKFANEKGYQTTDPLYPHLQRYEYTFQLEMQAFINDVLSHGFCFFLCFFFGFFFQPNFVVFFCHFLFFFEGTKWSEVISFVACSECERRCLEYIYG